MVFIKRWRRDIKGMLGLLEPDLRFQDVFKKLWETDELIVSFDGSCYIPKALQKADNIWTHTDQAPAYKGLKCYQGLVTLLIQKNLGSIRRQSFITPTIF